MRSTVNVVLAWDAMSLKTVPGGNIITADAHRAAALSPVAYRRSARLSRQRTVVTSAAA